MQRVFFSIFFLQCWMASAAAQSSSWKNIEREEMIKVLEQAGSIYRMDSYSIMVAHASYEDHKTIVPHERSSGYFKKDKSNYHSFILGIHTIQNENYKIVIDTLNKLMLVAKPDKNILSPHSIEDQKTMLNSCINLKTMNSGNEKRYRMELKEGYPLSAYEFLIDPQGMLKEITCYYTEKNKKESGTENATITPRLSITFSEYKKNPPYNSSEFDEKKYFFIKDNRLMLTEKYKDFKLHDQRIIK